jgi:tetratricopeptide (TPR) repeat protein
MTPGLTIDPHWGPPAARGVLRRLGSRALATAAVTLLGTGLGCGGADKKSTTTPDKVNAQSRGDRSGADSPDPTAGDPASPSGGVDRSGRPRNAPARAGGAAADATSPDDAAARGADDGSGLSAEQLNPAVTLPSYDPEPTLAKAQVEQHLQIARTALAHPVPDPETALREARLALQIDAASVDAAAMVGFAYYHKKLYDTAELVLDDLFKRDAAKQNPNVYYVYGLIYDHSNRPEQAVLSYKKALEYNPNHTSALTNLGVHQLQNTQYTEAVATFERLVKQFGKTDAVTLTSLGSSYRGHAADYPAGTPDRDRNVRSAEAAYKRALHSNTSYGPAYYNLGLLYLDNDPFPGLADNLLRLNTSKSYFDQYKNMPSVDIKLYDERMKDVTKAIKRAERQQKKPKSGSSPPTTPSSPGKVKPGAKRGNAP